MRGLTAEEVREMVMRIFAETGKWPLNFAKKEAEKC
jgi:hypothetical protein